MKRLAPLILAGLAGFAGIGAAAPVTRQFGVVPLQDVLAAAQATGVPRSCRAPLTANQLAVLLLVPAWFETVAGGSTTVTPSPMTLSRGDFGPKNLRLYSFNTFAARRLVAQAGSLLGAHLH